MKIVYSPSADQLKNKILHKYTGIDTYFAKLEASIEQSPYDATEEKDVIEGKVVVAYKRSVRTGLFSGTLFVSYLYLSLSYAINESKNLIIIIGAYVHCFN